MRTRRRVNKLAGDANTVATSAHAAFQDVAHAQFASNLLDVDGPSLVRKARIASDDEQAGETGQSGDDLLHNAVSKVLLLDVSAHILERQDSDGRFVGDCWTGPDFDITDNRRRRGVRADEPVAPARYGDHIGLAI